MKWNRVLSAVLLGVGTIRLAVVGTTKAQESKAVNVIARKFSYDPATITLKRGEPVTLVLKSEDVAHGIRFSDFDVNLKAPKGKTAQATFTPDKTGDFIGHCSVFCGSGHGAMTLTLHVVK